MDDVQFEDILEDKKQKKAEHIYVEKEENEHNSRLIENILNSDLLTPVQQEKMKMHYVDGESLATIGRKYGVTREAIRQTIQGCIKKLQGEFA